MSTAIKGVAGVSVPAAGIGGTYLYLNGMNKNMPDWKHLKTATSDKFGRDYQLYLADDSESDNDDWWQWSFANVYEPDNQKTDNDLSDEFKGIKEFKNLKDKCSEAYKKPSSDLTSNNANDKKAKYGRNAWKYCSKFGGKPSTIEDNSGAGKSDEEKIKKEYKGKIGEDKKSELVSVTDESEANRKFWLEREIEFFGPIGQDGLGKYNTTEKSKLEKKNIFDQHYDHKGRVTVTGEKLKKLCGDSYEQDKGQNDDGKVKDSDAVKFCGLKPQVNNK